MRLFTLGLVLTWAAAARAAPLEAAILPSHALTGDGERIHTLRLFVVDRDHLISGAPSVRASRGALVASPALDPDGGVTLRYRPPKVISAGADTLTVAWRGRSVELPLALEPAGRTRLQLEVPTSPLLLQKGARAEVKVHVRD